MRPNRSGSDRTPPGSIQALMLPILMAFLLLNARATIQPPPSTLALTLIAERRSLYAEP